MKMVQHRYAHDLNRQIVDAQELAKAEGFDRHGLSCIACEKRLIAKVSGTRVQPHFAHYPGTTCNSETYLHKLAKQIFANTFRECVATGEPFEIELLHPIVCRRFEDHIGSPCITEKVLAKTYDLTSYYNEVLIEPRDGSFIPDLLLFNRDRPKQRVYIEIAVTHFLSEPKEQSTERIVEIPIDREEDLDVITCRRLTGETARFVNFQTESQPLTESECACATHNAIAFIVYASGRCYLETGKLNGLISFRAKRSEKIKYFRLMFTNEDWSGKNRQHVGHRTFRDCVIQARIDGFPLKNCYLCRFGGDNFNGEPGKPIYCKHFRKTFASNEAVECKSFWLLEDLNQNRRP